MQKQRYDAIIIGAGVTGASIAYQLSKRKGRFLVLEEKGDVCEGTSKANSGIAHGGYDAIPGTMKAKMNKAGIEMMEEMAETLDFNFQKIGTLLLCHDEKERPKLQELYDRGIQNGISGMSMVERDELLEMEPNVQDDVVAALYCKEAGVVDPFGITIAFAEQANVNGVDFKFYQRVIRIARDENDEDWVIQTQNETYTTRAVVNAAGVFSDQIHNMVSSKHYHIRPRKGEYMLLDHEALGTVNHVIFDLPTEKGKGILVAPTSDYNILLGPTSEFIGNKRELETTQEGLDYVKAKAQTMIKNIPFHMVITSFTGLRAHEVHDDFILEEAEAGFFDCVGIESPGLTASPAIGVYMADMIQNKLKLPENADFVAKRKGIVRTWNLSLEDKAALIEKNPAYAQVICRCESVTEAEILDAIHRPLGAHSLDGIKRRIRPTAGRCQGGFCTPRLMEILSRELGVDWDQVTKNDLDSYLVTGHTK